MLVTYPELVDEVVGKGYLQGSSPEMVNAASIDLRLGDTFMKESPRGGRIDLSQRQSVNFIGRQVGREEGITMLPGDFLLACTLEVFNLPDHYSAEFSLKSSIARNGLGHLLAGWIDPGFNGSTLTLELFNHNRYHALHLVPGMSIGQIKVFRHEPVPAEISYRNRGRYNGDPIVQNIKP